MATSKFIRNFKSLSNNTYLTSGTLELLPYGNTYPTGALALTHEGSGDWKRDACPDGEYSLYYNGTIHPRYQRFWVGENRQSAIAEHFDAADEHKLKVTGLKDQLKIITDITTTVPNYSGQIGIDSSYQYYIAKSATVAPYWAAVKETITDAGLFTTGSLYFNEADGKLTCTASLFYFLYSRFFILQGGSGSGYVTDFVVHPGSGTINYIYIDIPILGVYGTNIDLQIAAYNSMPSIAAGYKRVILGTSSYSYSRYHLHFSNQNINLVNNRYPAIDKSPNYPFIETATFNNLVQIKNAIADIKLFNADPNLKYNLRVVRRNYNSGGQVWQLMIAENDSSGAFIRYVCNFSRYNYKEPIGLDTTNLIEISNSGIYGIITINWCLLNTVESTSNFSYTATGIDADALQTEDETEFVDINLPPIIYGIAGKELNIYFDNIIKADFEYQLKVSCTVGKTEQNNRWVYPTPVAGNYTLTVYVYDKIYNLKASVSATITIKAANVGNEVNKTCLFIGDSLTEMGNYFVQHVLDNFSDDVMGVTLIGTRGTAPANHEGRSGWSTVDYTTDSSVGGVDNLFFNPATSSFDFNYYMTNQEYTSPDYVCILLGTNDVKLINSPIYFELYINNAIDSLNIIIDSIHSYDSNIKILVMMPIPGAEDQHAFANIHGGNNDIKWIYKRGNLILNRKLRNEFQNQESNNIYIVPININLDPKYDFETETVQVSYRNSATVTYQSDCFHPADAGFYHMSDYLYYYLKCQED